MALRPTVLDDIITSAGDSASATKIARAIADSKPLAEAIKRGLATADSHERKKQGFVGPTRAQCVRVAIMEEFERFAD